MPVKRSESSFRTSFHDIYLFSPTSRRRLAVRWFSFRSSTNHFPVPPSILSRLYRPTAAPFGYAQAFALSLLLRFPFYYRVFTPPCAGIIAFRTLLSLIPFAVSLRPFADPCRLTSICASVYPHNFYLKDWNIFCFVLSFCTSIIAQNFHLSSVF